MKSEQPKVPDWQVELICLDDEHFVARVIALLMRSGRAQAAGDILGAIGDSPRIWRLMADAREGKPWKFRLTQTGLNIVKAWYAAACRFGAKTEDGCFNIDGGSQTMYDVKLEYARLFTKEELPKDQAKIRGWLAELEGDKKIPSDTTFRTTLAQCELHFHKDQRGAPRK